MKDVLAIVDPVRILAREFLRIGTGVRVWRPVGIPCQGDGGHGDDRPLGQPLFQSVVWRLAFGQAEAPAVVMDHDADVIRMVEGRRGTLERGRIDGPPRRGEPPDALGELVPVVLVQGAGLDLLQGAEGRVRPRFDRGQTAGVASRDCAFAAPIRPSRAAAIVMAAVPRKRRRSWSITLDIDLAPMGGKAVTSSRRVGALPARRRPRLRPV
jgi:hypothetical protein